MPQHYVHRATMDAEIAAIEAKGEVIVSVVAEGDNFQVFTQSPPSNRTRPGAVEKRPA
jgi:hypothetical protein